MKRYMVTYTSMLIEADSPEDAIARHEGGDSGGGNWEAIEIRDASPFTELLKSNKIETVTPWETPTPWYSCESCGCVFRPDFDGDHVWPDRFAHVNASGIGCGVTCECHTMPYEAGEEI